MLLKKIEIQGFKSFADKTEFELGKGVTCLVGPNGCGKSNVVDALKWALGEQRPTQLRGDSMADVIFKGNGTRPAMGFAEVTLVFDNEQGVLPLELSEVAITRRLLRSGDSEYLVNRQPVRLRDLRELFADTGLGHNAYAVLEQGKIDAVLRANPVERRAIFEEAAGIQRFRMRKREADRKLEKVDQNLLRVKDLIDELEKRVRSLRIQAGRARSYVSLTQRQTELKTFQYLRTGLELAARSAAIATELSEARLRDGSAEARLREVAEELEQREAGARASRETLADCRTRQAAIRAELDAGHARRAALQQREVESRSAAEERDAQARHGDQELAARGAEVAEAERQLAAFEAELAAAEALVREKKAALAAAEAAQAQRGADLDRAQRDIARLAGAELQLSNQLSALVAQERGLSAARERLVRREAELAQLLEKLRIEASSVQQNLALLGEQAAVEGQSIAGAREQLKERRAREQELRRQIAQTQSDAAAREARRETLDAVITKMEGVDEGSREVVKAMRSGKHPELAGVRGLLAELLPVPRDRARAADAALGPLAGAVVVEDRAALEACLAFLRSGTKGPATFLVLDRPGAPPAEAGGPGTALLDGVAAPPEFRALAAGALAGARVVDSESDLLDALGSGQFLVTPAGARLERSGAFADRPHSRALGFVERKVERDEVAREVELLQQRLLRLSDDEAKLSGEIAEWTAAVQEAERRKSELDAGIVESRSQGQRLRDRANIFRRELMVSARERFDLDHEERQLARKRAEVQHHLAERVAEREAAEEQRRVLQYERDGAAEALTLSVEEHALVAREVVRLGERARGVRNELAVLRRAVEEQASVIERIRRERLELVERAELAAAEGAALEGEIQGRAREREEITSRIDALELELEQVAAECEASREGAHQAAREREAARERLHQVELEERDLVLGHTQLRERAREEISLDIDERLPTWNEADSPPGEQVLAELAEVKEKIGRIGNVNLDAITELDEVEQRLEFLTREKADLDDSRKSLEETIAELDVVSKQRFEETFEAVRGHFRAIFRKLFHGGKADIFLQEGQAVLEAGVEIEAGPPGKDPRSITLLSGGERTMTAVALLFALFKAKPAPVAVLDEVDAALDESNVERFCNLLADFIGSSQFLIVTHSKRTMSYGDVIFGVTMEESGISKRIGIRLEEYEEKVA